MERDEELQERLSNIIGNRSTLPEEIERLSRQIDLQEVRLHQQHLSEKLHKPVGFYTALFDYIVKGSSGVQVDRGMAIDPVTGLLAQRYFHLIIDLQIKKAKVFGIQVSVIFLEIEEFEKYRALTGGEDVLALLISEVGSTLRRNCRKEDMLFRLGNGTFGLLLFGVGREDAKKVARRLQRCISDMSFSWGEVSVSNILLHGAIGVYPEDGKNAHTLSLQTENLLKTARDVGKGVILDSKMDVWDYGKVEVDIKGICQEPSGKWKPREVVVKELTREGFLVEADPEFPLGGEVILDIEAGSKKRLRFRTRPILVKKTEQMPKKVYIGLKLSDEDKRSISQLAELADKWKE